MALPPILPAPKSKGPPLPPILPAPKPARPTPAPPQPRTNTRTGANPRGVAITAPRPKPTVNDRAARTLATGNNPRGVAIAQHPLGGQGVRQAVRNVFVHQNPAAQAKILRGVRGGKVDAQTAAGVHDGVQALSAGQRHALAEQMVGGPSAIDRALGKIASIFDPSRVYGSHGAGTGTGNQGGVLATVTPFGGGKGAEQILKNTGKDAIDLPAQTFSTLGTIGGDLLHHQFGKAASDTFGPYVAAAEHPAQFAYGHPLDAYLMAAGALHGLTRAAAAPVRALAPKSALGKALSTNREGIQLAGNLTHERPRASPYPLIKAGQKTVDAVRYERSPTGALVPKSANLKAKLTGLETSRAIGVSERIRQANRDTVIHQRIKAIAPTVAAKAAHGAKTALKYNPDRAAIPGADVLARVADATIRRPDTFKADLAKHIQQVSANRANLLDFPKLLKEHDAYVKALSSASKTDHTPAQIARLFKAAESYREDYQHVQDEAQRFGQFGSRSQDALLKRQLQHYAVSHMDAKFDPNSIDESAIVKSAARREPNMKFAPGENAYKNSQGKWVQEWGRGIIDDKGIVHTQRESLGLHTDMHKAAGDTDPSNIGHKHFDFKISPQGEIKLQDFPYDMKESKALEHIKAAIKKHARFTRGGLVDASGRPLSNAAILEHLKGPEGTGGRIPAFTSDRARQGSAFYVSSERRPLPQNAKNTLFAYTHGLTNPSHEALLEQHVRMQGIVDAHKAQNRLVSSSAIMKPDGKAWSSFSAAQKDGAPNGYVPIALSQPFHALDSLDKALEGTNPSDLEHEAMVHGLDINARMTDKGQGRWALIDPNVVKRINEHTAQISSNPVMRGLKMTTNQFRQVALGTSAKHVPGVISETAIRSIANAEGLSSWLTGRRLVGRAEQLNPELGKNARIQTAGGTVAGMTRMMTTKQVSDHFSGTDLHGPLKAFESLMKAPGPRQVRTAWKAWLRLAINGTKKYVEEQSQTASLGKAALKEFGSEHGPFFKAMRLQGEVLDDAAKGLFDPKKLRQLRAEIENVRGRWTDLTPTGQNALMFSPFGLWWVNSAKWLLRSPTDRPLQTAALASATVGTEKERKAQGMDLFSPNPVPAYMQGGVNLGGGKVLAQNYYSPSGIANDFFQTLGSLVAPAVIPITNATQGNNYLGKPLTSPQDPHGNKAAKPGQIAESIANSLAGLFIPLYTKAEQIAQGGASAYDSSNLLNTQTKTPGQGAGAGLKKALQPYRLYHNKPTGGQASTNYSIPKGATNASGGQWNVVHSNPKGTGASGTTWKVSP